MTHSPEQRIRLSVVVPMRDEEDNVVPLLDELSAVLAPAGRFEVLLVDDASGDRSRQRASEWRRLHSAGWLRVVRLEESAGQSAAVLAGVARARAELVFTLDADRQNDPRDLLRMLDLLESGVCQAVCGVRTLRRDVWTRRAASRLGNAVRNAITGDAVRDSACGIRGMRSEVWMRLPRFDGMHRFVPTLARASGARVLEIPVNHRLRPAGRSKYGVFDRALSGLGDCFSVRWLRRRALRFEAREGA